MARRENVAADRAGAEIGSDADNDWAISCRRDDRNELGGNICSVLVNIDPDVQDHRVFGQHRDTLFDFVDRQPGEIDELKNPGIDLQLVGKRIVIELALQPVPDQREALGMRQKRLRCLDHISESQLDRNTGYAGYMVKFCGLLVDCGKNDWCIGPNLLAKAQCVIQARRSDRYNHARRFVLIFLAKVLRQSLQVIRTVEPVEINVFDVDSRGAAGAGGHNGPDLTYNLARPGAVGI